MERVQESIYEQRFLTPFIERMVDSISLFLHACLDSQVNFIGNIMPTASNPKPTPKINPRTSLDIEHPSRC